MDYVAHTRVKTPTAAAAFIIDHQAQEAALLDDLYRRIAHSAQERLLRERKRLDMQASLLPLLIRRKTDRMQVRLDQMLTSLRTVTIQRFERERHRMELMEQRLKASDPSLLLRRGFTITTHQGRMLTDLSCLKPGDTLRTITLEGEINSTVTSCKKKN